MLKSINKTAFFICVLTIAVLYSWFTAHNHYVLHDVYPSQLLGFFILALGFSCLISLLIGVPVIMLLERFRPDSYIAYSLCASVLVGGGVVIMDNMLIQEHPEGFVIGALVGLLYWTIKNDIKKKKID